MHNLEKISFEEASKNEMTNIVGGGPNGSCGSSANDQIDNLNDTVSSAVNSAVHSFNSATSGFGEAALDALGFVAEVGWSVYSTFRGFTGFPSDVFIPPNTDDFIPDMEPG